MAALRFPLYILPWGPPRLIPPILASRDRYLDPDRLTGGAWGCEVLPVACTCIGECSPRHLVVPIPLDGPAAIEEVLIWVLTPQGQEVGSLSHLLNEDLSGSGWDQPYIHVPCWQWLYTVFGPGISSHISPPPSCFLLFLMMKPKTPPSAQDPESHPPTQEQVLYLFWVTEAFEKAHRSFPSDPWPSIILPED